MKKMPTLFERHFASDKVEKVLPNVKPGCEWVIQGEGVATRKWDGTCTLIKNGEIFRRYDCKHGKTPPEGFIPADNPDAVTGHWPGWIKLDLTNPKGDVKFWIEAIQNSFDGDLSKAVNGTYELCGPKINSNPENFDKHVLLKHGEEVLENVPRNFEGLKQYLFEHRIEGIVFHRKNETNDMCKIKRSDYGFEWFPKPPKK